MSSSNLRLWLGYDAQSYLRLWLGYPAYSNNL